MNNSATEITAISPEQHRDQLQRRLIFNIAVAAVLITGFYSVYDALFNRLPFMALLNGCSAILFVVIAIVVHKAHSSRIIGRFFLLALLWVELYLLTFNPHEEYSFVWLAGVIPVIFILKGHRKGLYLSFLYATIFSTLYLQKMDVNGFANLLCSLYAIIAISYYYEIGWSKTEQRLVSTLDDLRQKSIVDELTDLYNRRYFNEILAREIQKSKRDAELLAFFMLDVDNFKEYNDEYGHHKGDQALSQIGHLLKEYLRRAGDYPFRLGGEEFGGVIHANRAEEVFPFVDAFRQAVENLNIEHVKSHNGKVLTVSIGLKIARKDEGITEEELYQMSDELLYKAKSSGRNRTCAG